MLRGRESRRLPGRQSRRQEAQEEAERLQEAGGGKSCHSRPCRRHVRPRSATILHLYTASHAALQPWRFEGRAGQKSARQPAEGVKLAMPPQARQVSQCCAKCKHEAMFGEVRHERHVCSHMSMLLPSGRRQGGVRRAGTCLQ